MGENIELHEGNSDSCHAGYQRPHKRKCVYQKLTIVASAHIHKVQTKVRSRQVNVILIEVSVQCKNQGLYVNVFPTEISGYDDVSLTFLRQGIQMWAHINL